MTGVQTCALPISLMAAYPQAEKAQGFLDGVSWAKDMPPQDDVDVEEGGAVEE